MSEDLERTWQWRCRSGSRGIQTQSLHTGGWLFHCSLGHID